MRRRRSAIIGEPTKFVIMSPRDVVTLEVGGGTATIIPETTVRIFCPVRRRFRGRGVVWRRTVVDEDGDVVGRRGRVKVTGSGILRIRKSRPSDTGVYSCTVGADSANLTLKFHSIDEALALAHQRLLLTASERHHEVRYRRFYHFCCKVQILLLLLLISSWKHSRMDFVVSKGHQGRAVCRLISLADKDSIRHAWLMVRAVTQFIYRAKIVEKFILAVLHTLRITDGR